MAKDEWYLIAFEVPARLVPTVLELMDGQCRNFRFKKAEGPVINSAPVVPYAERPEPPGYKKGKRTAGTGNWCYSLWDEVKALIESCPDKCIRYDDPRLIEIVTKSGRKAHTTTPMLSEYGRRSMLVKAARGTWRLP